MESNRKMYFKYTTIIAYMQSLLRIIIINFVLVINLKNKKLITAFGKHLRKLRQKKGLSMRYLADLADVDYTQIARIETGKTNTTISTVYALSKALDVSIDELFKFDI